MRIFKIGIQLIFYILILALFMSRAASSGFSHDENQFIASGQLLADHGLLPYIDYPFTHMPYAIAFYAISARLSSYDFLAGRLLNAVTWALCAVIIMWNIHLFSGIDRDKQAIPGDKVPLFPWAPSFPQLIAEFVLILVFLDHPTIMGHIDGPALNHSFATLFGLIAICLFLVAMGKTDTARLPLFGSGVFAGLSTFTRLNYAALVVVLLLGLIVRIIMATRKLGFSYLPPFLAGLLLASLPTLTLAALSPAHFYYTNAVYVRLNTIYYQELLFRLNMTLDSKLQSFFGLIFHSPIDIILYASLIFFGISALFRLIKTRSAASLADLVLAGSAATLALSAFAPTPTQPQYYFAPLPFMLVILGALGARLGWGHPIRWVSAVVLVLLALFATVRIPDPISELAFLSKPSQWTPVQMHDFDISLRRYVPDGRFLSLLPMLPLEAGYDVYPFTAAGGFPWRTSLLLTAYRRAQYGVTSPQELPQVLQSDPPSAILTRLESTNDGFVRNDLGGLETPFADYAAANGYTPIPLKAPFLRRTVLLWVKQP